MSYSTLLQQKSQERKTSLRPGESTDEILNTLMEEGTAAATRMLESDTVEPEMIDPVIVGEEGNEAKSDLSIHDQAQAVKDADLKRKQEELSKLLKRASSLVKKSKFIDDNIASHSRSADRALRAYKVMQAQKVKL